jgi:xanthine dehydrogenase small subunit
MSHAPSFTLNGRAYPLADADPRESLLRWLRRQALTGSKEGCADGDCGACTVALVEHEADGRAVFHAINSCLLPLGLLPGRQLLTVEALADGDALHPVQQALVDHAGSQCGYCTPGFVMSLFAGYHAGRLDDATTEGNLCRCTGYRSIRSATAALAAAPRTADRFDALLHAAAGTEPVVDLPPFHTPTTIDAALQRKRAHPEADWIAGATDLGVALSRGQPAAAAFIALDRIAELRTLDITAAAVRIGAGVPLSQLERELHGIFPALDTLLHWFAATQVKNRATLGGNLGSASPIGDLLPLLLALDATIDCVGPDGERQLPADGFFLAYRRTERRADELIRSITLPRRGLVNAAYKVAKRQTDDISIVAAVFALAFDEQRRISHARLAYGGVAAVPLRARAAEALLLGELLTPALVERVCTCLCDSFTPLSDHRAAADYRRALTGNLFAQFVAEHCR